MRVRTRACGMVAALTVGLTTAVVGTAASAHAAATITIDPPSNPRSGPVTLTGTVGLGDGETTSVLYVYDATDSTALPQGNDCSGNGSAGPEDDFNSDGSVGDILDCEISGVRALNNSLAGTSGLQAGIVAFANQAATADLSPDANVSTPFAPPAYTGGDALPRVETVARSVTRGQIGKFEAKPLGGSGAGTAFNSAIQVALATLAAAPDGPKWIMFLSDGQAPIDDALLDQLAASEVRLRSFGVGLGATCAPHSSLSKMAAATGETCSIVQRPASLAAGLTGSHPDAINGVTVTVKNLALAASVNAVGGWSATFNLGAGTYTATARAVLASGGTVTTHRTFTVAQGPGGPPPGSVSPGAGSLRATLVKVKRPPSSRDPLPSRVSGRVGTPLHGLTATRKLKGAQVLLQVRSAVGATWTTVDKDRVDRRGRFVLHWRAKSRTPLIRVALMPHKKYAGSAAAVPRAPISACKVKSKGHGWKLTCLTTARDGSRARLLKNGSVVDTSRVKDGSFRLRGDGAVSSHVVDVAAGKRHLRLDL